MARFRRFFVSTEYFSVTTELAKVRINYVATKQFYVEIELAKVRRNSVATEDFWVATELATTKVLYCPQQSRARTTGMHTLLGRTHDRSVSAIKEFCCDKEFSIATDLDGA